MNTILLLITGAIVAAFAFHYFRLNGRSLFVVLVLGVSSAYFGGAVLAPFLSGAEAGAPGLTTFAVLVAVCAALGAVYVSDNVWESYGV